jgi:PAS domain S-box-containing protein
MAIRQQQAIADLGLRGLGASDSLADLFAVAVADARAGLDADLASLFELTADDTELELVASSGWAPAGERVAARADGDTPAAQALRAPEAVLVLNRAETATAPGLVGIRSSAAVVIGQDGEMFGVLTVHARQAKWFGEADLLFLRSLANVLAAALARRGANETIERLAGVVEQSFDAIVSRTLDGTVTSWNAGAERMLGYSSGEIVGRDIRMLDLDDPEGVDRINERLRAGEEVVRFEGSRVRKDGVRLQIEVTVSPTRDSHGALAGAAVIMRDVTRTKALERQLRQSHRLESLGRLASGIAHDFNNALAVIRLQLDSLASHSDPRKFTAALGEVRSATDHAAALTAQLLSFGREQQLELRLVDLNDVIAKLTAMVAPLLGRRIDLTFSPYPGLHPVLADPVQMEQVLMNLAINARDAMPEGGKLTLETANVWLGEPSENEHLDVSPGWYAVVTVTDTGIGMDADTVARAFDPFFTTKPEGKGTGLGLATVYGIVRQTGGHIWVDSEPGAGTSVKLYLPTGVADPSPEPAHESSEADEPAATILVVDDNASILSLVDEILSAHGYETIPAPDPSAALALSDRTAATIDLLVTDISLPAMTGMQLAAAFTARNPSLRVLYMSGFSSIPREEPGVSTVHGVLLRKPFTAAQLLDAVRAALAG